MTTLTNENVSESGDNLSNASSSSCCRISVEGCDDATVLFAVSAVSCPAANARAAAARVKPFPSPSPSSWKVGGRGCWHGTGGLCTRWRERESLKDHSFLSRSQSLRKQRGIREDLQHHFNGFLMLHIRVFLREGYLSVALISNPNPFCQEIIYFT